MSKETQFSSELLRGAVADAKAVKATALANARQYLEEAFAPRFHAMFADKLKEESLPETPEPTPMEETTAPENAKPSKSDGTKDFSSKNSGGFTSTSKNMTPSTIPAPKDGGDGTKSLSSKNKGDIDGTPSGIKETTEEVEENIEGVEENFTTEDLDEIIKELEAEVAETDPEKVDVDSAPSAEAPQEPDASEVPPTEVPVSPDASEVPPAPVPSPETDSAPAQTEPEAPAEPQPEQPPVQSQGEENGEDVNLEELMAELNETKEEETEEDKEEEEKEECPMKENAELDNLKSENVSLKQNLNEAVKTVKFLRSQINEINMLNAKLLYTNRLFKDFSLSNDQKYKIVEAFDLTKNVREAKIVFATWAESLNFGATRNKTKATPSSVSQITEGLASKPVASTKPSNQIITESADSMAQRIQRLQKLAGISPKKK